MAKAVKGKSAAADGVHGGGGKPNAKVFAFAPEKPGTSKTPHVGPRRGTTCLNAVGDGMNRERLVQGHAMTYIPATLASAIRSDLP